MQKCYSDFTVAVTRAVVEAPGNVVVVVLKIDTAKFAASSSDVAALLQYLPGVQSSLTADAAAAILTPPATEPEQWEGYMFDINIVLSIDGYGS